MEASDLLLRNELISFLRAAGDRDVLHRQSDPPLWFDRGCDDGVVNENQKEFYDQLIRDESMPYTSPLNPTYSEKIEFWKRLPLWAANLLSPIVSGHLT